MVDSITATSTATLSSAESSSAALVENFDMFLSLLTAQLQNQDPLSPVDSEKFTEQLVQFSGVEQQIATNQSLEDLISLTRSSTAASLSGYIGRNVDVQSATAELSADGVSWYYELPAGIDDVNVTVKDGSGNTVYTRTGLDSSVGEHQFQWNGERDNGQTATSGEYTLYIGASDDNDNGVAVSPNLRTVVSGVDLSTGGTSLTTPAGVFDFAEVLRLTSAS